MREGRAFQLPAPARAIAKCRKTFLADRVSCLIIKAQQKKHFPTAFVPGAIVPVQLVTHPDWGSGRISSLPKRERDVLWCRARIDLRFSIQKNGLAVNSHRLNL